MSQEGDDVRTKKEHAGIRFGSSRGPLNQHVEVSENDHAHLNPVAVSIVRK